MASRRARSFVFIWETADEKRVSERSLTCLNVPGEVLRARIPLLAVSALVQASGQGVTAGGAGRVLSIGVAGNRVR